MTKVITIVNDCLRPLCTGNAQEIEKQAQKKPQQVRLSSGNSLISISFIWCPGPDQGCWEQPTTLMFCINGPQGQLHGCN